jgi:hypothetical protein
MTQRQFAYGLLFLLNPHHRGALEYLGEAYVELGCIAQARETLARLETACQRLTDEGSSSRWRARCEEWQELHAAITAYHGPIRPHCAP